MQNKASVNQPFQCRVCQARFTRHENLKRHASLHDQEVKLICEICAATCSRTDLLHRHMRRKHPEFVNRLRRPRPHHSNSITSAHSQEDWTYDDGDSDSSAAVEHSDWQPSSLSTTNSYSFTSAGMSPEDEVPTLSTSVASSIGIAMGGISIRNTPSVLTCADSFFEHILWLPIVHRSTLQDAPDHLLLAMSCLGDRSSRRRSLDYYQRASVLLQDVSSNLEPIDALFVSQSLLLLEVYALLYSSSALSAAGLQHHSRLVAWIRAAGLLRLPEQTSATGGDLDAMWRDFAFRESCKRTMLAVHQMDALWYHLLSIPRSLSHLEIKHEIPCPDEDWTATSASDWAYRRLTSTPAKQGTYPELIRACTSGQQLPSPNHFGLTNIVHFVLSSIREVSGWSTITNQVSMERVEPLKTALVTLEPFACGSPNLTFEATWRMTMVEFHIWSLSHTGGIVHPSIHSALEYATRMAAGSMIFSVEIIEAIESHVGWFLAYLDSAHSDDEPPFMPLFAYQVFLLAWQAVRQGLPNLFAIVGIEDTPSEAVNWARTVFGRRKDQEIGHLILRCLDVLECP